jgi:ribonucleoside-diphosphate reductase alpha chain
MYSESAQSAGMPAIPRVAGAAAAPFETDLAAETSRYDVIRRNGKLTRFDAAKISVAMTKAFLAVEGGQAAASRRIHETVRQLTAQVVEALFRRLPDGGTVHIEAIQDQVELALMRGGHHKVARAYVLYREEHARQRAAKADTGSAEEQETVLTVTLPDGSTRPLDGARLRSVIAEACGGVAGVSAARVLAETLRNLFDGIAEKDVGQVPMMSARGLVEQEPGYSQVAARLLLDTLRCEALSLLAGQPDRATHAALRSGAAGAGAASGTRPAIHLSRPPDPV